MEEVKNLKRSLDQKDEPEAKMAKTESSGSKTRLKDSDMRRYVQIYMYRSVPVFHVEYYHRLRVSAVFLCSCCCFLYMKSALSLATRSRCSLDH